MKKVFLCTAFLVNIFLYCSAQTTQEEYNYVTKGYKEGIVAGTGMMKGYKLKDVDEITDSAKTASLKKLIKTDGKHNKTVAYMVVYQQTTRSDDYICIPQPNSSAEIKDAYEQAIQKKYAKYNMSLIIVLLSRNLLWN